MKRTCPICQKEFELSKKQVSTAGYRVGYNPPCSPECRSKQIRQSAFNRRVVTW